MTCRTTLGYRNADGGLGAARSYSLITTPRTQPKCPAQSRIGNRNRGGTLLQVHQQVPSLLHGPRPAATGPVAEARGAG